jgi:hypothetical protein
MVARRRDGVGNHVRYPDFACGRDSATYLGMLAMKLQNTTDWPDWFLRRMVAWCCRQIGMPQRTILGATFRNSRGAWGGAARTWLKRITVCVGPESRFPASCGTHEPGESFADRLECLVAVTAHEAYHVAAEWADEHRQRTRGKRHGSSERRTCLEEMRILRLFRANREFLLADWSRAIERPAKPKASIQDKRAAKAQADLERWQRKLKLAQTKCRKLKQRVAYYDKALAAVRGQ